MKLLLAEDEEQLSRAVAAVLRHSGYEVDIAENGAIALELSRKNVYDCMIFDIMMPVMDGIEALKQIRQGGDVTPVIMLTAKSEINDRITGLDAGADDYLTKPFALAELMARVRSATRRKENFAPKILTMGNISLNKEQQELSAVNSIRLARKESELLEFFLLHQGREVSRQEAFLRVWADDPDMDEEIVWVYVSYLKNKLSAVSADVRLEGDKGGPYRICIS